MVRKKREATQLVTDGDDLPNSDYRALAGFRCELRKFMAFSSKAARAAGLEAQQYQAMLAVRAHEGDEPMTVSDLSEELFISVSTTVELVDRLHRAGFLERRVSDTDRRKTFLTLTPKAMAMMRSLAATHRDELRQHIPALMSLLAQLGRR